MKHPCWDQYTPCRLHKHTNEEEGKNVPRFKKLILQASRPKLVCMIARFNKELKKLEPPRTAGLQLECLRDYALTCASEIEDAESLVCRRYAPSKNDPLTRVPFDILCHIFKFVSNANELAEVSMTAYFASIYSTRLPFIAESEFGRLLGYPNVTQLTPANISTYDRQPKSFELSCRHMGRASIYLNRRKGSPVTLFIDESIETLSISSNFETGEPDTEIVFQAPKAIKHFRVGTRPVFIVNLENCVRQLTQLESLVIQYIRFESLSWQLFSSLRVLIIEHFEVYDQRRINLVASLPSLEIFGIVSFDHIFENDVVGDAIFGHKRLKTAIVNTPCLDERYIFGMPVGFTFVLDDVNQIEFTLEDHHDAALREGELPLSERGGMICRDVGDIATAILSEYFKDEGDRCIAMKVFDDDNPDRAIEVFSTSDEFAQDTFSGDLWHYTVTKEVNSC